MVSGGYIYGTVYATPQNSGTLFKVPVGGGPDQLIPITVGQDPVGGLVDDGGTILGVVDNSSSAGEPAIFSVNIAAATPTTQLVTTFASLKSARGGCRALFPVFPWTTRETPMVWRTTQSRTRWEFTS